MDTTFEWKPEPVLLEQVFALANQRGESPAAIVDQAVAVYLKAQSLQQPELSRGQALINLMRGKATAKLTTDEIMHLTRGDDD